MLTDFPSVLRRRLSLVPMRARAEGHMSSYGGGGGKRTYTTTTVLYAKRKKETDILTLSDKKRITDFLVLCFNNNHMKAAPGCNLIWYLLW